MILSDKLEEVNNSKRFRYAVIIFADGSTLFEPLPESKQAAITWLNETYEDIKDAEPTPIILTPVTDKFKSLQTQLKQKFKIADEELNM
jgi:hypothetical protein